MSETKSETLIEHLNGEDKGTNGSAPKLELVPSIPTIPLSVEHTKQLAEMNQNIQKLSQEREAVLVAARTSAELADSKVNLALSQRETLLYKLGVIYGYNPETHAIQPPNQAGIASAIPLPPQQMAPLPVMS